ncbi:MAG: Peptide chain release factor 2, partial [Candidatus Roizmanbacteria bacterium GW2011_GWC2_41_7]
MDELKERLRSIKKNLNLDQKREQIAHIKKESEDPSFWQDHETASKKMQELSSLEKEVEEIDMLELEIEEAQNQMIIGSSDQKINNELQLRIEKLELKTYLSGKYDKGNAI